jgi:rubrerythrin
MRLRGPEVGQREHDSPGEASSRRAVLGTAALAGIVAGLPLLRGLFRLGDARGSPSKAQDAKILQLVLQLEYTQVALYEQALDQAALDGELRAFAEAALAHEREHLAAIRKALGARAGPKPTFDFGSRIKSAEAFRQAAIDLEDTAVAGYNGQATNLTKATLGAAAAIVSVEARHAAWVRAIAGEVAAPDAVDTPMTAEQVARSLRELGMRTH